jgi:hypothetical protein
MSCPLSSAGGVHMSCPLSSAGGVHMSCPLSSSDFDQSSNITNIEVFPEPTSIKFCERPFIDPRFMQQDGWTDMVTLGGTCLLHVQNTLLGNEPRHCSFK